MEKGLLHGLRFHAAKVRGSAQEHTKQNDPTNAVAAAGKQVRNATKIPQRHEARARASAPQGMQLPGGSTMKESMADAKTLCHCRNVQES